MSLVAEDERNGDHPGADLENRIGGGTAGRTCTPGENFGSLIFKFAAFQVAKY